MIFFVYLLAIVTFIVFFFYCTSFSAKRTTLRLNVKKVNISSKINFRWMKVAYRIKKKLWAQSSSTIVMASWTGITARCSTCMCNRLKINWKSFFSTNNCSNYRNKSSVRPFFFFMRQVIDMSNWRKFNFIASLTIAIDENSAKHINRKAYWIRFSLTIRLLHKCR